MKKIAALFAVAFVFAALVFAVSADTFEGTMVRPNNADPNLFFYNGKYYMTQTGTSRIAVFETEHVDDLATLTLGSNISYTAYLNGTVYDPAVTELYGEGATINGTWSPELHYFSEEQFPGQSGWYMFLGLRKNTGDSSMVRMVVLKSTTDSPKGPYGHPTNGTKNYSQPVLDKNGNVWDVWACGQTILTIPEGKYKGTYTMWVAEEGRGQSGTNGKFYQKIMIAKMKSPWQFAGDPGIVATPTQSWEYAGASSTHPRVVEGATPVYGKNGEVFITYSGSGYWSDYGLGQLTWNGGDPLKTSSWVKLSVANGNPIFSAVNAKNLRGAGHASFLTDTDGNGFICYHAYAYENGKKASSRDAYIEPYYIDYTRWNGVSYGVITIGLNGDGIPADTASKVTFATDGEYLSSPDIAAKNGTSITLTVSEKDATGYLIYKSTDGKTFNYLTTVDSTTYTDSAVTLGNTYYYRAYAYREEEISDASATVSAKAMVDVSAPVIKAIGYDRGAVILDVSVKEDYDEIKIYRSADGTNYTYLDSVWTVSAEDELIYCEDNDVDAGTYYYYVVGVRNGFESVASNTIDMRVVVLDVPAFTSTLVQCNMVILKFTCDALSEENFIFRSEDGGYSYKQIAVIDGGKTTYIDTTVEVGKTYYYAISSMTDYFESDWSNDVKVTTKHMSADGAKKDATCTEDGYTAYTYCLNCETVLSGKDVVPATGHNHVLTEEEIPATTTSVGKTAVYTCAACGDSYGGEEIPMLELLSAPTLSVDTSKYTYFIINSVAKEDCQGIKIYFSTDGEKFELLVDSATDIVSGNVYTYNHKALTVGVTYYYYAVGYNSIGESEPSATVSETYSYVPDPKVTSLSAKCTGNEVVFSTAIKHDYILVYRSTNNSQFVYHDTVVGNTYTDEAVIAGKTYYYKFIGVINDVSSSRRAAEYTFSTKHDEVSYGWESATCTEDGHSGYSICNYCNEFIEEKIIYPATGHSYEITEEEIPATTTSVGKTAVYTCTACGDSYGGEEIPMLEDPNTFTMAGDANRDGIVNMLDALRTIKVFVGADADINVLNADVNGNGIIDIADVLEILKMMLNA